MFHLIDHYNNNDNEQRDILEAFLHPNKKVFCQVELTYADESNLNA